MQGLQDSDIGAITASLLILTVDAAVMVLGDIDSQVQLDAWESSLPRSDSSIALLDFCNELY